MKQYLCYIIIIVILAFLFPMILTKRMNTIETSSESQEILKEEYLYPRYGEITLYHTKDNTTETIPIDEYLLGVVAAEMPASYEQEALKAQAIVARTYTIYTILHNDHKHDLADICDDSSCCQAWISKMDRFANWEEEERDENWKKIESAVYETKGKIITYNGEPINAFFHANSGGKTEEVSNVWGGTDLPYLKSVETSGEDAYTQYNSQVTFSKEEFESRLKQAYPEFQIDYHEEDCIKIREYTNGNRVKTVKFGNTFLSGVEVRKILGLKSANFNCTIGENEITFSVKGYGHGVGMSQTGADSLAKEGKNSDEIIQHFYTNVEIVNI